MYDVLTFSYDTLHIKIEDDYSEPLLFQNLSLFCNSLQIRSKSKTDIIILGDYPKDGIEFNNVNLLSDSTKKYKFISSSYHAFYFNRKFQHLLPKINYLFCSMVVS